APSEKKKKESGNRKHHSFVRRRRLLEQRGVLKQKQLPVPQPQQSKKKKKKKKQQQQPRPRGGKGDKQQQTGGKKEDKGSEKAALPFPQPRKLVAIDCEMVGTGPGGRTSDLARCSIVSYDGDVMYDRYVRPAAPIVDYRTRWSGIRRQHMVNAVPFVKAQREILQILSGKVVVGHSIHNDFKALKYFHPKALTRDTSRIPLLNRRGGFPENIAISLKRLTKQLLHRDIQVGKSGHSSVEDARATMELYKVVEAEWEQHL
ncbi:I20L2 protein, partial [Bucco capensis]|nr:I20L2 protein [Bucco capensis]